MKKVLRGIANPNNWAAIIPVIFFFLIVYFQVLDNNHIAIITNGLDIGGFVLLAFAFVPVWFRVLRRDGPSPEAYLFGGILLMAGSVAASRMWSWAIIIAGKPAWMLNHWFQSFCYLMIGVGMFYLLKIPGSNEGWRGMRYIAYGLVLATGLMVSFLLWQINRP